MSDEAHIVRVFQATKFKAQEEDVPFNMDMQTLECMMWAARKHRQIDYHVAMLHMFDKHEGYSYGNMVVLDSRFPAEEQIDGILVTNPASRY